VPIELINPTDERWPAFCAAQAGANIFHHPFWSGLLAECYGYRPFLLAVTQSNGQITAGLPVTQMDHLLTGRRWVALPFSDHCQPLRQDAESLSCLMDGIRSQASDRHISQVEIRWESAFHPLDSGCVLHRMPLHPDVHMVTQGFHAMHRRNIKTALNRGVQIRWGRDASAVAQYYRLHLLTRRKQGVPIQPRRFFDLLGRRLIASGLGFILLAYHEDECIAGAVFLHWGGTLMYKYGASSEDRLGLRPNNLIFSTAIQWGCENGCTVFDLGKTDRENEGLRQFKSRWGAEETDLCYSTVQPVKKARASESRLKNAMQAVIRRSPPLVCRAAGEVLYRLIS
jgi:CelD/BcsL family acetyltransferase involved in cellulose biosynthesis